MILIKTSDAVLASTTILAVAAIPTGVTGNSVVELSTRNDASTTGAVASITAVVTGNRVVELLTTALLARREDAPAGKTRKNVNFFNPYG